MSSTYEKLSSNKAKLTIVIPAEKFDEGMSAAYKKQVKNINIPGFRKGKAPRKVIEMQYGEGVFYDDAFEIVFPAAYDEAVKEHGITPVDRPEIDVTQIGSGKDLELTVEVFVKPDVTLGDYKTLETKKTAALVTEDDVNAELERARERVARFIDVTDRPAKLDDTAVIDYKGFDGDEQFEGGTAENAELILGSGMFIPGFEEQVVGMNIGDEKDINVTFPEEYHAENLKGKPVVFKVKLNGIKEKELPELDDEFAKDVSEFDTLEEYKADTLKKLTESAENRAENTFENEVIEEVANKCEVDIPEAMIEEGIDNMLRDMEMRLMYQGMRLDDYLKYTGQTVENLRGMYKEPAASRVKSQLVIEAIMKAEGIEANDAEVEAEMKQYADQSQKSVEEFKATLKEADIEYFKNIATMQKTLDFLKSCANN